MVLYNPIEIQSVTDFGVLVPLGQESWFDIVPTIKETSLDLKSTRIDKRMCYFYNERHLKFFRYILVSFAIVYSSFCNWNRLYTQANCKLECRANYTLKMCGCVPYYLPSNYFAPLNFNEINLAQCLGDAADVICSFADSSCNMRADSNFSIFSNRF